MDVAVKIWNCGGETFARCTREINSCGPSLSPSVQTDSLQPFLCGGLHVCTDTNTDTTHKMHATIRCCVHLFMLQCVRFAINDLNSHLCTQFAPPTPRAFGQSCAAPRRVDLEQQNPNRRIALRIQTHTHVRSECVCLKLYEFRI